MNATLPTFVPFEFDATRDEHNRLINRYPVCRLCGDGGIVSADRECRPCWRALNVQPVRGELTYEPTPLPLRAAISKMETAGEPPTEAK